MIEPALTAEEWEARLAGIHEHKAGVPFIQDGEVGVTYDSGLAAEFIPEDERPALAALALYRQTFGFTRDHVEMCRAEAAKWEARHDTDGEWYMDLGAYEEFTRWSVLADIIEALLPPETPSDPHRPRSMTDQESRAEMATYPKGSTGPIGALLPPEKAGWICPRCGGREYFATGTPTCVACDNVLGADGLRGVAMIRISEYVKPRPPEKL